MRPRKNRPSSKTDLLITAITPQTKDPLRENIFLNGSFGFGISAEARFAAKLKVGQDLSESQAKALVRSDQIARLFFSAQKFLSFRPRSEKEVRDNLKRKLDKSDFLEPDKILGQVLDRLRKMSLVNDEEFARWWIEQRQKFRPKGERLLRSELHAKGISRELIDELFFKYESPQNEIDRVAEKKISAYQRLSPIDFRRKMSEYLARRGYDWDEIKSLVDRLARDR